jgi:hypothetical protein
VKLEPDVALKAIEIEKQRDLEIVDYHRREKSAAL